METVLPTRPRPRAKRKGAPPLRQLWQVPAFVLGMISLIAVAATRPLWSSGDEQKLQRSLAAARVELEREHPSVDRVIPLAQRALRLAPPTSPAAAEAHFLLGSAHILQAEQTPAELNHEIWLQARLHLEEAETIGLSPRDQLSHHYRLGKTYFHLGMPPAKIIEHLSVSVGADNSFEAYGLLAQTYLRLEPPDLAKALEAAKKQLALPTIDEASLARPRLMCADLHRQLDQPEEARKVLQRIGPGAPPELLFQARVLLARLLQDEGSWQEAAAIWDLVKSDSRAGQTAGRVWYDLGLCYRHLDKPFQALTAWEQAMTYAGEEGQAAALGVAELRLYGDQPPRAVEAFDKALTGLNRSDAYANGLVDLAEARRRVEAGCRSLLEKNYFAAALKLAEIYERIAAPGLATHWVGQAAEAWAKSQMQAALKADAGDKGRREEEARKLFRQAAKAYQATAETHLDAEARVQALWQSAVNYQSGQDHVQTIAILERFVQMPVLPERRGQAWFVIGETQRLLQHDFAAKSAYRKCIEFPGAHAFLARYQLGVAEMEKNNLDEAETMLSQNLEMMGGSAPNSDAREKTLYTLGGIHFQKKDYRMAMVRYQEALERYPGNSSAQKARLQLAQSCRQLADQASQRLVGDTATVAERDHYRKLRSDFLEKAAAAYQQIDEQLAGRYSLSPEEQTLARQAAFAVGDCRFDLGQYDEALKVYELLSVRYHHQIEGLIALRSVWQCQGIKLQHDKARATLERIRITLREMPSSAFDDTADNRSRRWWENWVLERIKLADSRSEG